MHTSFLLSTLEENQFRGGAADRSRHKAKPLYSNSEKLLMAWSQAVCISSHET